MINCFFMHILYVWKGRLYSVTNQNQWTNQMTLSYIECLSTLKNELLF